MSDNAQTEVLVAGAGPVGMLTALLLTQQGVRTRIIDQEARNRHAQLRLRPASRQPFHPATRRHRGRRPGPGPQHRDGGPLRRPRPPRPGHAVRSSRPIPLRRRPGAIPPGELLEEKLRSAGVRVEWHRRLREIQRSAGGVDATIEKLPRPGAVKLSRSLKPPRRIASMSALTLLSAPTATIPCCANNWASARSGPALPCTSTFMKSRPSSRWTMK